MKLEEISTESAIDLAKGVFVLLGTIFASIPLIHKIITAGFGLKKISSLSNHTYFDFLQNEKLWLDGANLDDYEDEKKAIFVKRYITLKLDWWRGFANKLITNDFMFEGVDLLNSTEKFSHLMYSKQHYEGFVGRHIYFVKNMVNEDFLAQCNKLVTQDIIEATHKSISSVIKNNDYNRYRKAHIILDLLIQGIMFDNRAVIKHAKTWDIGE